MGKITIYVLLPWSTCITTGPPQLLMPVQRVARPDAHGGHDNQLIQATALSEDGKQNRLHYSPGQVLQQVSRPMNALRWTWSANSPWKDFLTVTQ